MAYSNGHPLMVLVEEGVKNEGLLERGNDWFVQTVKPERSLLSLNEFNGVLSDWKTKILENSNSNVAKKPLIQPAELTLGEILKAMKPKEFWGLVVLFSTIVTGAFALGAKSFGA